MATSPSRRFNGDVFEQFARIGEAVASPKRLELVDILCQGPRTVEVLADHASLSFANATQHLHVLRAARLVEAIRVLRAEGFSAVRLESGPPEWRAAGVPVEASS